MIFLLLAIIIAVAQIVQTISGFGSGLVTVTIAISFMDLNTLLPILVPLNLLQSSYIALRYRSRISWPLLYKTVIPLMFIGIILGIYTQRFFSGSALKNVFGVFIAVMAAFEIYKMKYHTQSKKTSVYKAIVFLPSSGFIHAIYACGGPPLVYYLGTLEIDKKSLRSTLATIWVVSNIFLVIVYYQQGLFDSQKIIWLTGLLPVVVISIWLGDKLHHYVSEEKFRLLLYTILFFAGVSFLFAK